MPPAVAERHAVQHLPRRPDRGPAREQRGEQESGGDRALPRMRDEMIEEMAGPRRRAEHRGRGAAHAPSRRSSAARPSRPTSGLSAATWKPLRQRSGLERRQRRAHRPARRFASTTRTRRPRTGEAGDASPSERPSVVPGRRIAIAPRRAGAGVEQNAGRSRDRSRARALERDRPATRRELRPAIDARRRRSGASGCGRGCADRDRLRDRVRARSRRRGEPLGMPARDAASAPRSAAAMIVAQRSRTAAAVQQPRAWPRVRAPACADAAAGSLRAARTGRAHSSSAATLGRSSSIPASRLAAGVK